MKADSWAGTCLHYFVTSEDFALTVYESPLLEIEGQKSTLSCRKIVQQVHQFLFLELSTSTFACTFFIGCCTYRKIQLLRPYLSYIIIDVSLSLRSNPSILYRLHLHAPPQTQSLLKFSTPIVSDWRNHQCVFPSFPSTMKFWDPLGCWTSFVFFICFASCVARGSYLTKWIFLSPLFLDVLLIQWSVYLMSLIRLHHIMLWFRT